MLLRKILTDMNAGEILGIKRQTANITINTSFIEEKSVIAREEVWLKPRQNETSVPG